MSSDNITASFGGSQIGTFNRPEFGEGEDSNKVINKPINTARQAYEAATPRQRISG